MKIYGHPWSISTRKVLMTLREKGLEAELALIMIPKQEQKTPEHVARHPFAKVPVLEDDGFVLYESGAIERYLDKKGGGIALVPSDDRGAALVSQWISVSDSYFAPHAGPFIVESMFRRYLGGEQNLAAIEAGKNGMQLALDTADRWFASHPYFAGSAFSLADVHWMPYIEYLVKTGNAEHVLRRVHLAAWWERVSARKTWHDVARTGPQPYESGMSAEVIERRYR